MELLPEIDFVFVDAYHEAVSGGFTIPSRALVDRAIGDTAALDPLLDGLAKAAGEGDPLAIERLIYAIDSQRLAGPGIRRVLFQPADVDEVSQDVLIAVAEHVTSFRGESHFRSWLFGVARNKALEFLRRKRNTAESRTELGDAARISSLVVGQLSVQRLLSELPDHYRVPVTLRDVQGLAYADIAETLDLNLNTVRARIARGRALVAANVVREAAP